MNKYKFELEICGGYPCGGLIEVEANGYDTAVEKAQDSFVNRWIKTFPELDVDYNVELNSIEIDKKEIKRKIEKARILCPGNEDLEMFNDGCGHVEIRRYSEYRGSAETIDGMDDDETLLWDEDSADYDENFNPEEFKKLVTYVSGF